MNNQEIKWIYGKYSASYDRIFSHFFLPRIKLGLRRSRIQDGDRVIEVGVGTGISLPLYPRSCSIVGIDVTRKMLEEAKRKKEKLALDNVHLLEMDGENLTFPDNTFDHSVAAFVVSVVPNPERMVREMKRVTKKGGNIIILNHFCGRRPLLSRVEKFFSPICEKWGWRSDISMDLLSNHCNLQLDEVFKKNNYDPWSIVIASNNK